VCGYKLATNWQNFTEILLVWVKILQKVLRGRGLFFMTHTVVHTYTTAASNQQ